MEDYEFYSVDPNEYMTEAVLARTVLIIDTQKKIRERKQALFNPTHTATIPGLVFPLEAFILGDAVLTRCKTVADLEATLLKR